MKTRTWICKLPEQETNVDVWIELGDGRWLAFTVWGAKVYANVDGFTKRLEEQPEHWEELK